MIPPSPLNNKQQQRSTPPLCGHLLILCVRVRARARLFARASLPSWRAGRAVAGGTAPSFGRRARASALSGAPGRRRCSPFLPPALCRGQPPPLAALCVCMYGLGVRVLSISAAAAASGGGKCGEAGQPPTGRGGRFCPAKQKKRPHDTHFSFSGVNDVSSSLPSSSLDDTVSSQRHLHSKGGGCR